MEKCNLDELLEALSEMDQAAIQQAEALSLMKITSGEEKLNTKLQAELHAQTHELGRLHAELAAAPAPDAPVAQPPVSPGKMRCFPVWIAAIAGFCLLLMSCNFFQAALENRSFEHLVQKTFLQRFLAPSPSLRLSADASQTSSEDYSDQGISKQPKIDEVEKASGSNSRKVQQLSTTWEGNASSGDELAMITPAPSKFVKQAGTSVHEELEDKSELAKRETRGDRATPTSTEADDTSRQEENEEKQPEPKKQVVDVDMASASEEPSAEAQGAKETQAGTEADDTSRQEENEEKQPEPKKLVEVDMASASEEPSAEAQGAKETQAGTEADDTSRQEENEEKQPEPQKQAEVDMASASEEPSAEAQGAKEAQTFTEADDTSRQEDNEEKQPDPHKQAEVDMASASEEPSAEAHGEKGVRSSIEADASCWQNVDFVHQGLVKHLHGPTDGMRRFLRLMDSSQPVTNWVDWVGRRMETVAM
eukprot:symbB.v1.2.012769.t1/scaffold888.1/size154975/6